MSSLSVVIPVYHNAETLAPLYERLSRALEPLHGDAVEVIFVDDGSRDASYQQLRLLAANNRQVRVVKLSRNFGSTAAILAGLTHATGDCAAVIAADLQDPPELIPLLVERFQQGFEVVLGARATRDDPWGSRLFSAIFYWLFRRFAISAMPPGGFDCFLASRRVYHLLVRTASVHTYLMGHLLWLGFARTVVYYDRRRRPAGRSMWTLGRKIRYFIDSFVAFSYAPIRVSSLLGLSLAAAGFLYALVVIAYRLLYSSPVEGWSSLMIVVLLLCGAQLVALGVLGEYLWRALDASRQRPAFIVESTLECTMDHGTSQAEDAGLSTCAPGALGRLASASDSVPGVPGLSAPALPPDR